MRRLLFVVSIFAFAPMAFGMHAISGGKSTLTVGPGGDVTVGDVITVDLTSDIELTAIAYIHFVPSAPNPRLE